MSEASTEATQAEQAEERFQPLAMHGLIIEAEHLGRYAWAAQLAGGKRILDAASGMGYGTRILAAAGADQVIGIDLDEQVVAEVNASAPDAVSFQAADIRALPFEDDSFDLITCFETIEHVPDPEIALDELRRVLAPGGVLVLSTPNRDVYTPGNPFHLRELTPNELEGELAGRFASVRLHRQHTWVASAILADAEFVAGDNEPLADVDVRKAAGQAPGEETYTVALAGDGVLPPMRGLLDLTTDVDLRHWSIFLERAAHRAEVAEGRTESEPRAEAELERKELAELRGRLIQAESEVARLSSLEIALRDSESALTEGARVLEENQAILSSISWRVTAPLRRLNAILRRFRG